MRRLRRKRKFIGSGKLSSARARVGSERRLYLAPFANRTNAN